MLGRLEPGILNPGSAPSHNKAFLSELFVHCLKNKRILNGEDITVLQKSVQGSCWAGSHAGLLESWETAQNLEDNVLLRGFPLGLMLSSTNIQRRVNAWAISPHGRMRPSQRRSVLLPAAAAVFSMALTSLPSPQPWLSEASG